eukprot:361365-Chlamydomonas_euryale.AAC.3
MPPAGALLWWRQRLASAGKAEWASQVHRSHTHRECTAATHVPSAPQPHMLQVHHSHTCCEYTAATHVASTPQPHTSQARRHHTQPHTPHL